MAVDHVQPTTSSFGYPNLGWEPEANRRLTVTSLQAIPWEIQLTFISPEYVYKKIPSIGLMAFFVHPSFYP
jgi:hypothetical protein